MFVAYGIGASGCRHARIAFFSNRLASEPLLTAAAVVVFAPHEQSSATPMVATQTAWGDDWLCSSTSCGAWIGVNHAQSIIRVNEQVFDLPDRSHTLVIMTDVTNQVSTRSIITARVPTPDLDEPFLALKALFGALRNVLGGPPFVSKRAAWGLAICALPEVDAFLAEHRVLAQ